MAPNSQRGKANDDGISLITILRTHSFVGVDRDTGVLLAHGQLI